MCDPIMWQVTLRSYNMVFHNSYTITFYLVIIFGISATLKTPMMMMMLKLGLYAVLLGNVQASMMDAGGAGGHVSGSGASGSHSSGLSPNVASMSVMPPLNPLPGFGFGGVSGAPMAHGGPPGYPAQPLSSTGCSPLYLPPPPAGVVGPIPYPAAVSSPPHSLVHCGSPYPTGLHSPGGSGLYATPGSGVVANGSTSKLMIGRHMCAICEDAASGKHYGVYRSVPNSVSQSIIYQSEIFNVATVALSISK